MKGSEQTSKDSNATNKAEDKTKHRISDFMAKLPVSVKALIATLMALGFTYIVKYDIMSISFFAPMEKAADFSFGDFYTAVSKNDNCLDYVGGVVMVPVDSCSESEVADVIRKVDSLNPAVVGFDIIYSGKPCAKDSELAMALAECRNLVMPVYLKDENGNKTIVHESYMDTIVTPSLGYAVINVAGDDNSFTTVRKFRRKTDVEGDDIMTLPVALVARSQPEKIEELYSQRDDDLLIRYLQQVDTVYPSQLNDNSFIEGAIVLIGNLQDYSDMHITPIGNHTPGLLIQGLSVATILSGDYIWTPNKLESFLIGAVLCYLIAFVYFRLGEMTVKPIIIRIAQLLILILMIIGGSYAFHYCNVDMDFSYSILAVTVGVASCEVYEGLVNENGVADILHRWGSELLKQRDFLKRRNYIKKHGKDILLMKIIKKNKEINKKNNIKNEAKN
ncbi:MAG: CHASE2 domain-containing protein [Muribaculaceae bacterium]|nr:CHASE2 domain-containing protein [Muribaculaceae bacterium]